MPTNPDSLDIVQLEKQESAALGGDAADEEPFAVPLTPIEDAIEVAGVALVEPGKRNRELMAWRDGDDMRFRDVSNPGIAGGGHTLSEMLTGGGGGITEGQHRNLDQLPHNIAENSVTDIVTAAGKVTAIRIYTDVTRTTKIREEDYVYTGNKVTTSTTKQYNSSGVLVETYTETISYSGNDPTQIVGVLS